MCLVTPQVVQKHNWREYAHFEKAEYPKWLIKEGKGTIMVTAHYGNFDFQPLFPERRVCWKSPASLRPRSRVRFSLGRDASETFEMARPLVTAWPVSGHLPPPPAGNAQPPLGFC